MSSPSTTPCLTTPPVHCNHNKASISRYERLTGNCTRLVAKQIIATISPPITTTSYILDNACGPGIVSEQIKLAHPNAKILATDLNAAMVESTKTQISASGWTNIETDLLDVRSLHSIPDETFTHAITNFGMTVPGDPDSGVKVAKELFRVLQVGGVAVATTWADRVWPAAFIETKQTCRPNEPARNPLDLQAWMLTGSWLMKNLEDGGFGNNVEVRPYMTFTTAKDLDELTDNMMFASQAYFQKYSEEEMVKARAVMREALRKCRTFVEDEDGVRIGMKAWIGVGWKRGDEKEVPQ